MAQDKLTIIKEIKEFIIRESGSFHDWYVGIATNPRERLFTGHNVNEKVGPWIFREAIGSFIARKVEEYFVDTLSTDGGTGGGDDATTKYVYAYLKTSSTKE